MPVYATFPTSEQWNKDMGFTGRLIKHDKFPAAVRVGELLDRLHPMLGRGSEEERIEIIGQLWMLLRLMGRSLPRQKADRVQRIGSDLTSGQGDVVIALFRFCEGELQTRLNNLIHAGPNWRDAFRIFFGRPVGANEQADDVRLLAGNRLMQMTPAELGSRKLAFRKGLAYRKDDLARPYDTAQFGDAIEAGGSSLYVMSERHHIFVYGRQNDGMELKHSSFLSGNPTLAAGTMRWTNGKLEFFTPQSGHYKPQLRQMLNVAERLQAYQVDVREATFCRVNFSAVWMSDATPRRHRSFQPCSVTEFLRLGHFPDTRYPNSMFIDANGIGH